MDEALHRSTLRSVNALLLVSGQLIHVVQTGHADRNGVPSAHTPLFLSDLVPEAERRRRSRGLNYRRLPFADWTREEFISIRFRGHSYTRARRTCHQANSNYLHNHKQRRQNF